MNVSVRELKNRLSQYLRRAQRGEEVIVTSRGEPVARLGPLPRAPAEEETALVERLLASPWVRPGRHATEKRLSQPVELPDGVSLTAALLAERKAARR